MIYIFLIPPYLRRGTDKETDLCFTSLTSWQIDGETVETVTDCIFEGSKITADGDCSHELERAYSLEGKL